MKRKTKGLMDIRHLLKGKPGKPQELTPSKLGVPEPPHQYGYFMKDIIEMMSAKELRQFGAWMNGQTGMIVDGNLLYYTHDVLRFLNLVRNGQPTYFD
jgi:hypothetical protein